MNEYPLPFSEFHPGLEFITPTRRVSVEDIRTFSVLSGDHNPLHEDPAFAQRTRFGGIIAQGALTFSILTGLWDQAGFLSGTVEAFVSVRNLRFRRPVRPGDSLHARVRVIATEPRAHGQGLVTFDNRLYNDRDEAVLICETVVLVRAERPLPLPSVPHVARRP
jgi:acyl dehydratase